MNEKTYNSFKLPHVTYSLYLFEAIHLIFIYTYKQIFLEIYWEKVALKARSYNLSWNNYHCEEYLHRYCNMMEERSINVLKSAQARIQVLDQLINTIEFLFIYAHNSFKLPT